MNPGLSDSNIHSHHNHQTGSKKWWNLPQDALTTFGPTMKVFIKSVMWLLTAVVCYFVEIQPLIQFNSTHLWGWTQYCGYTVEEAVLALKYLTEQGRDRHESNNYRTKCPDRGTPKVLQDHHQLLIQQRWAGDFQRRGVHPCLQDE